MNTALGKTLHFPSVSLCLFRACLGELIVFSMKRHKCIKTALKKRRVPHPARMLTRDGRRPSSVYAVVQYVRETQWSNMQFLTMNALYVYLSRACLDKLPYSVRDLKRNETKRDETERDGFVAPVVQCS